MDEILSLSQHLRPGVELRSVNYTYIINKVLGQGAFGITYLATTRVRIKASIEGALGKLQQDRLEEVQVAIKEFFMREANSRSHESSLVEGSDNQLTRNYRKKFRREAENLASLDHPNIVKVLEVFDANNTSYYVMEYIEGKNLDEYIPHGGMNEEQAKLIISEVAQGLQYMHRHRMLHLDIKPKNIMVSPDGRGKLIDFGLSKQYNENDEPESSTSIGLGTPGYAPLEQSNYKQDGTFPATLDIYALGATYYKMLTGKIPPPASDVLDEGLPSLPGHFSLESVKAIDAAMQPRKKNRPQSIDEWLALLDVSGEETMVEAEPVGEVIKESEQLLVRKKGRHTDPNSKSVEKSVPAKSINQHTQQGPAPTIYKITPPEKSNANLGVRFLLGLVATLAMIGFVAVIYNAINGENEDYDYEKEYTEIVSDSMAIEELDTKTVTAEINTQQAMTIKESHVLTTSVNKPTEQNKEEKNTEVQKVVEPKIETPKESVSIVRNNSNHEAPSKYQEEKKKTIDENDSKQRILVQMVNNMVGIKGGTFTMGSRTKIRKDAPSSPRHSVTITKTYYLGKYEVTQEEWMALMGYNPSKFKGSKLPVHNVTWNQCQEFVSKLNQYFGTNVFRLPTEAEWEFASRGGNLNKKYKYSGSDRYNDVAWVYKNSNYEPHQVGQKKSNDLGLFDMSGNVTEWCSDRFGLYDSTNQTDPVGPSVGDERIMRGLNFLSGAIDDYENYNLERRKEKEDYQNHTLGFRLATDYLIWLE